MHRRSLCPRAALVLVPFLGACAATSASDAHPAPASGGLTTLYLHDDLRHAISFRDGRDGNVVQDDVARNVNSDLCFGACVPDALSAGIEGGRIAAIVDLGTEADLVAKYGFQSIVGGTGFSSIRRHGAGLEILKSYDGPQFQALTGLDGLSNPQGMASAPVQLAHVYLVRITDRDGRSNEVIAKVLVLEHAPGQSVTIRWQRL